MTAFRYRALTAQGKKVSGTIDAGSRRDASQSLREQGMHVTSIDEAGPGIAAGLRHVGGRRSEQTYLFTSHMRRLLRARLPLVEALDATGLELASTPMGPAVTRIRDKVAGGAALAEAVSQEQEYFDELYIAMIQSAQASGNLAAAFENIHQYEGNRREFRRRLTAALAYPVVLVVTAILVIIFLVSFVVPRIAQTLLSARVELPLVTKVLILVGNVAKGYWWVAIALLVIMAILPRTLRATVRGRLFFDNALVRLPLAKRFAMPATLARFARTFSALLSTGLRVADALEIAGKVSGNAVFEKAVSLARSRIVGGGDLAGALSEGGLFPTSAVQVVSVGERTGTLADSFGEIAKAEEEDLQTATDRFMTFLEPAIILAMAVVVGFIVASVLLPLLSMSTIGG
jgi:type II secretory pathway component PulF